MPGRVRAKVEYVSLAGLRLDGRRPTDPRELEIELGCFRDGADGSAMVVAGGTKVLAAVYGPKEVIGARDELCKVSVKCQFAAQASMSGHRRMDNQRATDTGEAVRSVLEGTILRALFPSSTVHVHLDVLVDDGSVIPTLLNACSVALASAGIPVRDLLVACSASLIDGAYLVDVTDQEARATGPSINVALFPSSGNVAMCTVDHQIDHSELETLMNEASKGCQKLHGLLKAQITEHTQELFKTRAHEK